MNGRIVWETLGSVVLKGNPLGDPRRREVPVYLPPSYGEQAERRYPVVYFLQGFTGTPKGQVHVHPWKEGLFERLDRLIVEGRALECLLVMPDCFTRYGGSQYRNSEGTGRYEDHVAGELVGYIDAKYRTLAKPEARAVMGKSSGGYGALWLAMRHPELFGHALSHSGDMLFELCYQRDFGPCASALGAFGGSFARFVKEFSAAREKDLFPHALVNMAGMASVYSANPKSPLGFELPFDERTGEIVPAVWRRWLDCDPVRLAAGNARALGGLKTLYVDCGRRDEFFLHLGARAFSRELKKLGVRHSHEEFDGGHSGNAERFESAFALLKKAFSRHAR